MSLFEVQTWLGHKHPASTQHYAKVNPVKLTRSYEKAGYFERNVRAIDVLIDQDVVRKGTGNGEPWKYFDLGHGFCAYDFFDQCPHRMACARCSFYVIKESSQVQVLEAKGNLLRPHQDIPLSEPEIAAVEQGVRAYGRTTRSTGRRSNSRRLYAPGTRGGRTDRGSAEHGEVGVARLVFANGGCYVLAFGVPVGSRKLMLLGCST